MAKISDKCLRGNIQQNADTDIEMMANCQRTDCCAATDAAYGTLIFIPVGELQVDGPAKIFHHFADSGAVMERHLYSDCGSQLFGKNPNRAGMLSVRAGGLGQTGIVKPGANVYLSSKSPSNPVAPELKGY